MYDYGDRETSILFKEKLLEEIQTAINEFKLNLSGQTVLTEAATGCYVVTPLIAAQAGATVYGYTENSDFGDIETVKKETYRFAREMKLQNKIDVITSLENIDLSEVDILTNTGFLRPITEEIIKKLSENCVIPLMWEPWEFREDDLDLEACAQKGIKVYGTDESDEKLKTVEYLAYIAMYHLLHYKLTPFSSNILLLANERFAGPIKRKLRESGYQIEVKTTYDDTLNPENYSAIVVAEHERAKLLIGASEEAFISKDRINTDSLVVHICGNIEVSETQFEYVPEKPATFGNMSFGADFIDSKALVELHTAGLKVGEGMLEANSLDLGKEEYKHFMEDNYPALSFKKRKFW